MSINKIQEGNVLRYINGGEAVKSGDLLKIGDIFGVAALDIAENGTGAVDLCGVFEVPCELSAEVAQGAKLYFKESSKKVTDESSGNVFCGICFEKTAQASTTILLKIGYLAEAGA